VACNFNCCIEIKGLLKDTGTAWVDHCLVIDDHDLNNSWLQSAQ